MSSLRAQKVPSRSVQTAIGLERIMVSYRIPHERVGTFKEFAIKRLQGRLRFSTLVALKDIDLAIQRGEALGIIGRNGAGKSTLLKVIARVLRPTSGRVWISDQVSPLLELGAGFHPELTGRENIFLNGVMLSHSRKEIEQRFESIVEFAELGEFIDAPLRSYSTGMMARLGFAVATEWNPQILIIDEVLSVGDEAFQRKCEMRMESFRRNGATVLLVSHDLKMVEMMCQRAVWLDHGTIKAEGLPSAVVRAYQEASAAG